MAGGSVIEFRHSTLEELVAVAQAAVARYGSSEKELSKKPVRKRSTMDSWIKRARASGLKFTTQPRGGHGD